MGGWCEALFPVTYHDAMTDGALGFGHKLQWLAVRGQGADAIAAALNLSRPTPAIWRDAVAAAYDDHGNWRPPAPDRRRRGRCPTGNDRPSLSGASRLGELPGDATELCSPGGAADRRLQRMGALRPSWRR